MVRLCAEMSFKVGQRMVAEAENAVDEAKVDRPPLVGVQLTLIPFLVGVP
jgi:hypothetical protein